MIIKHKIKIHHVSLCNDTKITANAGSFDSIIAKQQFRNDTTNYYQLFLDDYILDKQLKEMQLCRIH